MNEAGDTLNSTARPNPVRILYIDDDVGVCRLVQRALQRGGFVVDVAHDAEQGLALARTASFDSIALDHYMPGRDGLEALDDMLRLPDAPPVIFVTAAEEPRIAVTALKAGAFDYVVKDVQGQFIDQLRRSVLQAREQRRLLREKDQAERELRDSRDRLAALAAQQALLLREMNHRVANSLQMISSLIELQARRVADPQARQMLKSAAERVEAVNLVHRRLYTGDDVSAVRMDQYLAGLVEELGRATVAEDRPVRLLLTADPIRVETDKAVSLGLIVNELVTNALKYAYPAGRGDVRVGFTRRDGRIELVVEDDGVGISDGAAPRGSGLGGTIVTAMARNAGAVVRSDHGAVGSRIVVTLNG